MSLLIAPPGVARAVKAWRKAKLAIEAADQDGDYEHYDYLVATHAAAEQKMHEQLILVGSIAEYRGTK